MINSRRVGILFLPLLIPLFILAGNKEKYKTVLVYSCNFETQSDLEDWVMEGPGVAEIQDGKLIIYPRYYDAVVDYLKRNNKVFDGLGVNFYEAVEAAMRKDLGEEGVKKYYNNGEFSGGHIVYWNKFVTPNNYILECDFQSLSEHALHMVMFSVTGMEGEDVFADHLKKRNGVAAQYTQSDLYSYRISFFAPGRDTSNMRKTPGKRQTIKGPDYTIDDKTKVHHLKIVKYNNTIEWYINGKLSFHFKDDLEDGPLAGGQTALRLMVPAKGLYDNYKIYEIVE